MSDMLKLKTLLKYHEGLWLKPYRCPKGYWTIGCGHNLEAHGEPIPDEITLEQAEKYLEQDLKNAIADCARIEGFAELDQVRQAVLIDMCFMGIGKLLGFHRMLTAISAKKFGIAAIELLDSDYAIEVGNRAKELAAMMLTGMWWKI